MRRSEFITEKRDFKELTAAHLMQQNVVACRPEDSGRHLASQLTKFGIGSIPIVEGGGKLVGLVSEFDLLKVLMNGKALEQVKASDIMTKKLKTVTEDTDVQAIIKLLETEHLIRLPVVKDEKLKGIVARNDVLFGYIKATAQYWP